nr:TMEM192 family [Ipomoea batatas]
MYYAGIFQQYLVYQVKKIRLQGHYIFSQKLKHIIRLPFATIAYGTAAMLLVMVWKPHISFLSTSTILRFHFRALRKCYLDSCLQILLCFFFFFTLTWGSSVHLHCPLFWR